MPLTQSRVLKNIKNYQPKVDMQEKKSTKNLREREGERNKFFFVRENCAQNGRDNDKFIVRECE